MVVVPKEEELICRYNQGSLTVARAKVEERAAKYPLIVSTGRPHHFLIDRIILL